MQERLQDIGLLGGIVDGRFGPGTQQAIAGFQTAAGIEATGAPDQRTLIYLLWGRPQGG